MKRVSRDVGARQARVRFETSTRRECAQNSRCTFNDAFITLDSRCDQAHEINQHVQCEFNLRGDAEIVSRSSSRAGTNDARARTLNTTSNASVGMLKRYSLFTSSHSPRKRRHARENSSIVSGARSVNASSLTRAGASPASLADLARVNRSTARGPRAASRNHDDLSMGLRFAPRTS